MLPFEGKGITDRLKRDNITFKIEPKVPAEWAFFAEEQAKVVVNS